MKQNLENENGQRSIMDSNNNIENGGEERRHMSVSSDEVNYLIYRYLQECGFVHAAFTFSHESMLLTSGNGSLALPGSSSLPQRSSWQRAADRNLPPGALVTFLQKGLQYIGIEETILQQHENKKIKAKETNDNDPVSSDFSLLSSASIQALTRRNPPIQLTVPPAAAAAAVKARLEAEGIENDGSSAATHDPSALARIAAVAMTHQIQMQQQQQQILHLSNAIDESAGVKRSTVPAPGSQRKKQKVATNKPTSALRTVDAEKRQSFRTLDQAMAQLEASKKNKQAENDTASRESSSTPAHEDDARPSFVNGQVEHKFNGRKEAIDQNESMDEDMALSASGIDDEDNGSRRSMELEDESEDDDERIQAKPEEILMLDKHVSEVFMCAWNPVYTNLIATGSGDASARIWEMKGRASEGLKGCIELPHGIETGDRKNKDVTTLEWSSDGLLLATGSYDGIARVWDRTGVLIHTLRGHEGPIFSLKWNKRGNFLLSGSYDKTIIVWNVSGTTVENANGFIERQFKDHEAPALDVDWKDDTTFASCSTDRTVHIYKVDEQLPRKVYRGHEDEVNAVKWSPSGKYLASCSDDCTAKVWDVESDRTDPLYDFSDHKQEIYTVKWSPTGQGSNNPGKRPLLATASFDGSIRLWNISDGSCYGFFNQHRDSVYSVAFSPSGDFLASGSLAGQLYIWDVAEQKYIKSYKGEGDIFEVAWNKEETRVAACFSSNVVAVIDFNRAQDAPPRPALPAQESEQQQLQHAQVQHAQVQQSQDASTESM